MFNDEKSRQKGKKSVFLWKIRDYFYLLHHKLEICQDKFEKMTA